MLMNPKTMNLLNDKKRQEGDAQTLTVPCLERWDARLLTKKVRLRSLLSKADMGY